jgi:nitrogen fixation NifU-like protein
MLHLYLYIQDGQVKKSSFKTFGCAAAIAAGSILTEMVIGRDRASLENLCKEDVVEALGGLPPMKMHCSVLAEDAIRAALKNFNQAN